MTACRFQPTVEMTFATADADHRRLLELCRSSSDKVLTIDLSAVTQCDSAGLAMMIEARRLARQFGKDCKIAGMTKDILALAEFCGLEKILLS